MPIVLATGCSDASTVLGQLRGSSEAGPLDAGGGGGSISILAPNDRSDEWVGVFGTMVCLGENVEAKITDVDYQRDVPPLGIRTRVRTVSDVRKRETIMPTGSRLGSWDRMRGRIRKLSDRPTIKQTCPFENGFTEVVTELRAGPKGASVDGLTITYAVGEESYTLDVDWLYALCGTEVKNMGCHRRR